MRKSKLALKELNSTFYEGVLYEYYETIINKHFSDYKNFEFLGMNKERNKKLWKNKNDSTFWVEEVEDFCDQWWFR